ncbi:MAG: riboflavin biosynthesis protein RibF [Clostridia bacterium]
MNKYFLTEKCDKPIVLALGFFDCVHLGHKILIDETVALAKQLSAESAIFTFASDPNEFLGKQPQIYTIKERESVFANLKLQNLIFSHFDKEFSSMSGSQFLDILTASFNIKAIVVGHDYTYGKNAECKTTDLQTYMKNKSIQVKIVPFEKYNGEKISTSSLKKLVVEGKISILNTLITEPYFLINKVVAAHQRGTILGFPTANLCVHHNCLKLGTGVYATKVTVDGNVYDAMTNVGAKLTFGDMDYSIESYIFDFSDNIYGKEIRLQFYMKLRDVVNFGSSSELQKQLKIDSQNTRNYFATICN